MCSNDFLFEASISKVKSFQNKEQWSARLCQQKRAKMSETGVHLGYLRLKQLTPPCASAGSSSLCAAATLDRHKNKTPAAEFHCPPVASPAPYKKKKKKTLIHQLLHLHTNTAPFKAEWRRRRWSPTLSLNPPASC